jgi:hypothetical protein
MSITSAKIMNVVSTTSYAPLATIESIVGDEEFLSESDKPPSSIMNSNNNNKYTKTTNLLLNTSQAASSIKKNASNNSFLSTTTNSNLSSSCYTINTSSTNSLSSLANTQANKNYLAASGGSCTAVNTTNTSTTYKKPCIIDPDFEYKGYYKFGRILGRGSFGTVIECVQKFDEKPIALKLFKFKAIHQWIPETLVMENMNHSLLSHSEFFNNDHNQKSSQNDEIDGHDNHEFVEKDIRMLPSEVACLIRAHNIDGVVKILDYIPESSIENEICCEASSSTSSFNSEDQEPIIGIVLERDPNEICFFDYLMLNKYLCESEAKLIMRQLVEICINLLHAGILHGDLK